MRKLVFEQQLIGQQQLATALANDFAGLNGEQLRQHLINSAPKYGNDVDDVDQLLVRAYQTYIDELKQYHNTRLAVVLLVALIMPGHHQSLPTCHLVRQPWQPPDGRKAHSPLAEGASPASGTDHLGPTAVFNSLSKLPTASILGGVAQPEIESIDAG